MKRRWRSFPHARDRFELAGPALKKLWPRLHRGDCEPFPKGAPLQDAWRAFHRGDYELAAESGLALGADGSSVANKATSIYATYLEPDARKRLALFEEAAGRAQAACEERPDDPNAFYLLAYCLGRHAQKSSVLKALTSGTAGRIRQALDRALQLAPRHADAHTALATWHAEVIDKAGGMMGALTYGASQSDALAQYRKALALHPESAIARVEYAAALTKMDATRKAEARRLLAEAVALEPADATEQLDVELARRRLEAL